MSGPAALGLWAISGGIISLLSAAVGAVVALPSAGWRKLPWPLQARQAHVARIAPWLNVFVLSMILVPVGAVYLGIQAVFAPPLGWMLAAHSVGVLLAVIVALASAWNVSPRRWPIWRWLAGCFSAVLFGFPNVLVFTPMAIALVIVGFSLPSVLAILILGAIGLAFSAWGGGILVARALRLARRALPRAQGAADWAGERVGVRANAVYELIWPKVTVDSFMFSRFLVLTDSAAELLSDEELLALSIREITFFQQPGLAGTLRIIDTATIFLMLACTAIGATINRQAMLVGGAVGLISAYGVRPITRRVHLKADALAAQAAIDPRAALLALEKQYELNLAPVVVTSWSGGNPHLYDRLIAAGIQPAYPRPTSPSRGKIVLSMAATAATCAVLSIAFIVAAQVLAAL